MTDPRYTTLRILIDSGRIKLFKEIFDYIPIEDLARDMDCEVTFLEYLTDNPSTITINNMKPIWELIDCELDKLLMLAYNQYFEEKGKH